MVNGIPRVVIPKSMHGWQRHISSVCMLLQLYIARWTTERIYRSAVRHIVADEHQQEVRAIKYVFPLLIPQ